MKKITSHKDFRIPEGYLEGFTSKFMEKLPKEAAVPEKEGFGIPEDYFEGLHDSISKKLKEKEHPKVIQLSKNTKGMYYSLAGVAAVLLIFLGITTYTKSDGITFEDLATSDIENYFDMNTNDLSSYELAEVIPDSDLEEMSLIETSIEDTAIIEYLDANTNDSDFEEFNFLDYE